MEMVARMAARARVVSMIVNVASVTHAPAITMDCAHRLVSRGRNTALGSMGYV